MSLRRKTLLVFAAALIVLIGSTAALAWTIALGSFEELEARDVRSHIARAQAALSERIESLATIVGDWSPWDDSYEFVGNGNPTFVESNLNPPSIANLGLDLVVYADLEGRLVFAGGFDLEQETLLPVPETTLGVLTGPGGLVELGRREDGISGVLVLPDRIQLMVARPILRSDRSGPVQGTLLMGRPLDDAAVQELGRSLGVRLSVHRATGEGAPADLLAVLPGLSESRPVAVRAIDDERVAGYALVHDIFGRPGLVLRVELPRDVLAGGRATVRYLVLAVGGTGGLIAALGFVVLYLAMGRLSRLTASVARVGASGDASQRVVLPGHDEVSGLGDSINKMLEALQASQRRLREGEEQYRKDLESRVRERTAELMQLNKALEATALEMERARDEADRASKAKSDFLSRMSHELRTPLNAVLGFGQLLQLAELTTEQKQNVEDILKAGRHLLRLVDEVLDIARIETGRVQVPSEPVGVGEVLSEAIDLTRPTAERLGVKVSVPDPTSFSCYVLADRRRVTQVLINLLSNAVKYGGRGTTVTVTCALGKAGPVRISVADTGPGIPPEKHDRLFVPFDRLGAEQGEVEGIGLGLALSRRFVEAMGGSIGVDSAPGRGSTFWIELPRAEDESSGQTTRKPSLPPVFPPADGRPLRTVLYIEDDPVSLRLAERMLDLRPDVRLIPATRGETGLELARQLHPDVVLLDLQLPDVPGLEVLACLRADPATRDLPVVIVSGDATPARMDEARRAGAQEYLTKPVSVARLHRALARFFDAGGRGEA